MNTSAMCRAVFLDRDGVINKNRSDHVKSWAEFEFLPGVFDALRELAALDVRVIVISNQGAIGRGMTTFEAVDDIHARMLLAVQTQAGRIDDVLYCPHKPDEGCVCRKPKAGMLKLAADKWQLDLSQSFLIGDADTDILAGHEVGCHATLVLTGRTPLHAAETLGVPVAHDLLEAVRSVGQMLVLGGNDIGSCASVRPDPSSSLHPVEDSWNSSKIQI